MNKQESDILKILNEEQYINQRTLSELSGHSLGIVNRSVKSLQQLGFLDEYMKITGAAKDYIKEKSPKNAIILAAGFGMRMVPINREIPKGLLDVKGEILIERLIRQLHEAGIYSIFIVVGFMKEQYEYLMDRYQVKLIVNPEYAVKNNLHSLKYAVRFLSNCYIVPCDIWCRKNPFSRHELYSWYLLSNEFSSKSTVRANRKLELVMRNNETQKGNEMIGICYLEGQQSENIKRNILQLCENSRYDNAFWEEALFSSSQIKLYAKVISSSDVMEVNTYEQLRSIDDNSRHLISEVITIIANALQSAPNEITNIEVLKKGMTNRSFLFSCRGRRYIMRIPGEGTELLINRANEAAVYRLLHGRNICDKILYINPVNGYKITEYLENARVCNPQQKEDVEKCMKKLRGFHRLNLRATHEFDLFKQIDFYESLWENEGSVYQDYKETKHRVLSLRKYIEAHAADKVLTHIDAVPDNFLFMKEGTIEEIYLIDWEYAGMQDPHVDIAMFGIYSFYDRQQMDLLINMYFQGMCTREDRIKIYCYIAVCGLLWSNWCEYKRYLGVDFGEYSLRQYRYAKDYYRIVHDELGGECQKWEIK